MVTDNRSSDGSIPAPSNCDELWQRRHTQRVATVGSPVALGNFFLPSLLFLLFPRNVSERIRRPRYSFAISVIGGCSALWLLPTTVYAALSSDSREGEIAFAALVLFAIPFLLVAACLDAFRKIRLAVLHFDFSCGAFGGGDVSKRSSS